MDNLDIKLYDQYNASIKDLSHEIDISEIKWNKLITPLLEVFDSVYFKGFREYFMDEEYQQTINYLSEQNLIEESGNHMKLMFRFKEISMMSNRNLVAKLWQYFEFPSFIFLGDRSNEERLVYNCKVNQLNDFTLANVDDVLILQRLSAQDVLWIKSNVDIHPFLKIAHLLPN